MNWKSRKLKEAFVPTLFGVIFVSAVLLGIGFTIGHDKHGFIAAGVLGTLYMVMLPIVILLDRPLTMKDIAEELARDLERSGEVDRIEKDAEEHYPGITRR